MRLNIKARKRATTHEGGPAVVNLTPEQMLRRTVASCLLWEGEFYEDGQQIADRIETTAHQVSPRVLADLAIEARNDFNLRHVPLLLLTVLASTGRGTSILSETIPQVVRRADELSELLAIYWRNGKRPIPKQMKRGLAEAFGNFNGYQLAKYNRDGPVRLRDVMFLVRPVPKDEEQAALWRRLADNDLESPDTWEVALSAGADKRETFERLLREEKLGYLALLRNLRNMSEAGVDPERVRDAIIARRGAQRVLPFRYVAAARACPQMEPAIDQALSESIAEHPPLTGRTVILVDVSVSMDGRLSRRSDLTRMDAAAALASVVHGDLRVFSFSAGPGGYRRRGTPDDRILVEVPPRRGMAGVEAVIRSQAHGGTMLGRAVREANDIPHDRLIVITDEQSADRVPDPMAPHAYMINVASNRNGVGYGRWVHIDGFSESVLRFIHEHESAAAS